MLDASFLGSPWLLARRAGPLARIGASCAGLLVLACTFGGYVPTEPPPPPLAESEANIADLPVGSTTRGDLDCPAGRCRVRYRIVAPAAGELAVTVGGPAGNDGEGEAGPRLARAVLEGVGQQALVTRLRSEGPPPFVLSSRVQRGVHYVLIQGLGGPLEYDVTVRFTPEAGAVAETGTLVGPPDGPPAPERRPGRSVDRTVVRLGRVAPGDVSDGADVAADPKIDVMQLRTYAFAQDPAAMLQGEPGSSQGNVFLLREIQRQIRYTLADLGKRQAPANEADFLVAVGVGSQSTTWWSTTFGGLAQTYDYYFDLWGRPSNVQAHTYQDGTLLIDFVDPKSGGLLWHGWTVEPIPVTGDDKEVVKKAVQKVLGQL